MLEKRGFILTVNKEMETHVDKNKPVEKMDARPAVVGMSYRVLGLIGRGSFGIIYEGIHILEKQPVAIKFESRKSSSPQLRDEYRAYRILAGSVGIPSAYYFGHESLYNCLVIDLLGPSLEELFTSCSRQYSVKTVAMLAKQMITRIQTIHEKNLIYRDIKPDNFLVGRNSHNNSVFIVDFGMAKHFRDPKTKQHIPYRERRSLSGTARYMSINTHLGREQSRRDDVEALGHVFFYFLRGSLPWQGLKAATNKEKYERIGERKQNTAVSELCHGYPAEFGEFLRYARDLEFEQEPDYNYLRRLMDTVLRGLRETEDFVFDWIANPSASRRVQRLAGNPTEAAMPQPGVPLTTPQISPFVAPLADLSRLDDARTSSEEQRIRERQRAEHFRKRGFFDRWFCFCCTGARSS